MLTPRSRNARVANCPSTSCPTTRSVLACSDTDVSVSGEGKGEIRTNDPLKALRLGPQLDFQAGQGIEWVFRVSFL